MGWLTQLTFFIVLASGVTQILVLLYVSWLLKFEISRSTFPVAILNRCEYYVQNVCLLIGCWQNKQVMLLLTFVIALLLEVVFHENNGL